MSRFFMRPSGLFALCLVALLSRSAWGGEPNQLPTLPVPPARISLILGNGQIKTGNGWAQALAVSAEGVIVATGTTDEVARLRGAGTRFVDLKGDAVLPGLQDLHVHPIFGGLAESRCKIAQGLDLAAIQKALRGCAARTPKGAWINGGQWDASAIGRIPTRAMLDAVVADRPVLLSDTSGHSAWVNSMALQLAGLNKDSKDPAGGIIERDASGEPTGVLREMAIDLVRSRVPPPSLAEVEKALTWSVRTMLSYGITSFTEASVGFSAGGERELQAYANLAERGVIKQRVRLCLAWGPGDAASERLVASRNLFARPRLSADCVKLFLDGVPTDSHTAAMMEPYVGTVDGRDDPASQKGLLQIPQDVLNGAVTRFDRMGLTVKFHAAGDGAVHAALDAIEAARRANGAEGPRHDVGHCTFVNERDFGRARALNASFEVSPYLWAPGPINDTIAAAVGPSRVDRSWPVRSMLEAGANVVAGSDWAVVPSVNPWIGIETLLTRESPGGSAESWGKAQAIGLEQALALFTENAARHMGTGDRLGRLDVGMLADLVVLDRNPFETAPRELHKTRVKRTYIAGELVYDAGKPDK